MDEELAEMNNADLLREMDWWKERYMHSTNDLSSSFALAQAVAAENEVIRRGLSQRLYLAAAPAPCSPTQGE